MDPCTLAYLAGHSDFSTTKRYVHPQADAVRAALDRARAQLHSKADDQETQPSLTGTVN